MRRSFSPACLLERLDKIGDRLRFAADAGRQAHMERAFDPQNKFRSGQTIDPEILFETARWGNIKCFRALGMKFADQFPYDRNETLLARSVIERRHLVPHSCQLSVRRPQRRSVKRRQRASRLAFAKNSPQDFADGRFR